MFCSKILRVYSGKRGIYVRWENWTSDSWKLLILFILGNWNFWKLETFIQHIGTEYIASRKIVYKICIHIYMSLSGPKLKTQTITQSWGECDRGDMVLFSVVNQLEFRIVHRRGRGTIVNETNHAPFYLRGFGVCFSAVYRHVLFCKCHFLRVSIRICLIVYIYIYKYI